MSLQIVGLVFDFVLLILLVATIGYAARLSLVLKKFKENRDILDRMIKELNKNVGDAEQVIQKLQNSARTTGGELQKVVDNAAKLSDELSLMSEAGDNLATRLEKLADRNSVNARSGSGHTEYETAPRSSAPKPKAKGKGRASDITEKQANKEAESFLERVFAIRDPDAERGENPLDSVEPLETEDDFHSEAERDLLNALQGKK